MGAKKRADRLLVEAGLAETREKAQALIMAGLALAAGVRVEKPGQMLDPAVRLSLAGRLPFVGRGGLKLAEALDVFGLDPAGKTAADIGASTGGFTDCLLQRGARRVYAVDVDTRQLDWKLRSEPRVTIVEKNARHLSRGDFLDELNLAVVDVSFISVLKVLPALREVLPRGELLVLIKPQFEAGRREVGRKGIIRDPAVHEDVILRTIAGAREMGFGCLGIMRCSTRGQKGNVEFFARFGAGREPAEPEAVRALVKEAVWDEEKG